MMSPEDPIAARWSSFVEEVRQRIDVAWNSKPHLQQWLKSDASRVTSLDFQIDALIRMSLAAHFPHISVLSEETGFLRPVARDEMLDYIAIVDPIDGTESLVSGRNSWWVSIAIARPNGEVVAGWVYQPELRRSHDSKIPKTVGTNDFLVALSPDRLHDQNTGDFRHALEAKGATIVALPHAVEKVVSVLEGRTAAAVYLPSTKSPSWRSWDLAAAVALARSNGILLADVSARPLEVTTEHASHSAPWICAASPSTWETVRGALRQGRLLF